MQPPLLRKFTLLVVARLTPPYEIGFKTIYAERGDQCREGVLLEHGESQERENILVWDYLIPDLCFTLNSLNRTNQHSESMGWT